MRVVELGGGGGLIWGFGAFAVLAVLGACLIVVQGVLRQQGKARRGGLSVLAVWTACGTPIVAAALFFGRQIDQVAIADDGGWSLRNGVGIELGRIAGEELRTVETSSWVETSHRADRVEHPYWMGSLEVETEDGRTYDLTTSDMDVWSRLGYDPDSPCKPEVHRDGARFPPHTYTRRGPSCPSGPPGADPGPGGPGAAGEPVFALWPKDGWWYPAVALRTEGDRSEVAWSDGTTTWRRRGQELGDRRLPASAHLEADAGAKGRYFPCTVKQALGAGRYVVEYADSSTETVGDAQLRFRPPGAAP